MTIITGFFRFRQRPRRNPRVKKSFGLRNPFKFYHRYSSTGNFKTTDNDRE